jgi:hypothetical protein
MNGDQDIKGLRERLASAATPEEINRLLEEGSTYTDASERTRAAWRNTAARRRVELVKIATDPEARELVKIASRLKVPRQIVSRLLETEGGCE